MERFGMAFDILRAFYLKSCTLNFTEISLFCNLTNLIKNCMKQIKSIINFKYLRF